MGAKHIPILFLMAFLSSALSLVPHSFAREGAGAAQASASHAPQPLDPCVFCFADIDPSDPSPVEKGIFCPAGYGIHQACFAELVYKAQDLKRLETEGMQCFCKDCKNGFTFEKIMGLLTDLEKVELADRIAKSKMSPEAERFAYEVKKLREDIEKSFTICCPRNGCGAALDEIAGCNAAKCSERNCERIFCYLCLAPQADTEAAHKHVKEHSKDYWERRDGHTGDDPTQDRGQAYQESEEYTVTETRADGSKVQVKKKRPYTFKDRYHWELARKKLESTFNGKIDPKVRAAALAELKPMLEKGKMWPVPAGLFTKDWIQEVKTSQLPERDQTALLQNEYIFLKQTSDPQDAALVQAELTSRHAPVLASLDAKDRPPQLAQQANAQANAAAPGLAADIQPFLEFERVPAGMTRIGDLNHMYRVGNLVWSDRDTANRTHQAALDYCVAQGGRLPTQAELDALRRAMGYPDRYDRNRIPNMAGNFFWSSDEAPPARPGGPRRAFGLHGYDGNIVDGVRVSYDSVRCVVEVRG